MTLIQLLAKNNVITLSKDSLRIKFPVDFKERLNEFTKRKFWIILKYQGIPKECSISLYRFTSAESISSISPERASIMAGLFNISYISSAGNKRIITGSSSDKLFDSESDAFKDYISELNKEIDKKQKVVDMLNAEIEEINEQIDNYALFI